MAGDDDGASESSAKKFKFRCCKIKETNNIVCIKCGKVFHYSCAERDFPQVSILKDSRAICCGKLNGDNADLFSAHKKIQGSHYSKY